MANPQDIWAQIAQATGQGQVPTQRIEANGQAPSPLDLFFQQRGEQFNNMRSPMVRRDISGRIVDENAPSGLDALRPLAPSWETVNQPGQNANQWNPFGGLPQEQNYQVRESANGNRAIQTPYGGGSYSPTGNLPGVGRPDNEQFETRRLANGSSELVAPMTPEQRAMNAQQIQQAFNDTYMNPAENMAASASPQPEPYAPFGTPERSTPAIPNPLLRGSPGGPRQMNLDATPQLQPKATAPQTQQAAQDIQQSQGAYEPFGPSDGTPSSVGDPFAMPASAQPAPVSSPAQLKSNELYSPPPAQRVPGNEQFWQWLRSLFPTEAQTQQRQRQTPSVQYTPQNSFLFPPN